MRVAPSHESLLSINVFAPREGINHLSVHFPNELYTPNRDEVPVNNWKQIIVPGEDVYELEPFEVEPAQMTISGVYYHAVRTLRLTGRNQQEQEKTVDINLVDGRFMRLLVGDECLKPKDAEYRRVAKLMNAPRALREVSGPYDERSYDFGIHKIKEPVRLPGPEGDRIGLFPYYKGGARISGGLITTARD